MSFQAMAWAVRQPCKNAGQKLVLIMLANYCNSHTGQCNPSHKRLAEECSMGVSTLKSHLNDLQELGLLTIIHKAADGVSLPNQYMLKVDGVGQNLAEGRSESGRGVGQNLATNLDVEPRKEPQQQDRATSGDSEQYEETFIEFWKNWPTNKRKGSKPQCGAFWKRKKLHLKTKQILEHVNLMKNSHDWTKDNGQYMPAPLTYLHQMRWEGAEPTQDQKENKWAGAI